MSDPAARAFYEIEAERENWSTPHLERQIFTALHLRLLKSRNKAGVMELARAPTSNATTRSARRPSWASVPVSDTNGLGFVVSPERRQDALATAATHTDAPVFAGFLRDGQRPRVVDMVSEARP